MVSKLLETLAVQSIVLTAERRMGKTQVMRLIENMAAPQKDRFVVVRRDLEGLKTAAEFVQDFFDTAKDHIGLGSRFQKSAADLGAKLSGTKVGPIQLPNMQSTGWKKLLEEGMQSSINALDKNQKLIFLWDEMPLMLQSIIRTQGHPEAMELLDVLRKLRQSHASKVTMIFTGSLGLHHVIDELTKKGYTNRPLNDMVSIEVPPLDTKTAAIELAQRLLRDNPVAGVEESNIEQIAEKIAQETDGVAFYIHHVVKAMQDREVTSAESVVSLIHELVDLNYQSWELPHFYTRTASYYPDQLAAALRLLDSIATFPDGISLTTLLNAESSHQEYNKESALALVEKLKQDFYIVTSPATRRLHFKSKVVHRYWVTTRDLPKKTEDLQ